jgi:hypothetical protein
MSNGVRWKVVPIAYVTGDPSLIRLARSEPTLKRLKVIGPSDPRNLWINWKEIYDDLAQLAAGLWRQLVETLPTLGWALGLDMRGIVKKHFSAPRRGPWPANQFYDAKHDVWFHASLPQRRVRSLVAPAENAIGRAIRQLADFTFEKDAPEREAQLLFEMFPALVDATSRTISTSALC